MDAHDVTTRRRVAALAAGLVATATLAACSGSGEDEPGAPPAAASETAPVVPDLPRTVSLVGPITEPAMQPVWLVRSTGTAESREYDVQDQGVFVDGDVVVYFALDTILGVSREDGSTIWKTPVDMGGEIIEYAATRAYDDHRWSFVYSHTFGKNLNDWGQHLVTIDTQTGEVLRDDNVGTYGTITSMANVGDQLYLATEDAIASVTPSDAVNDVIALKDVTDVKSPQIRQMTPVQGTDILTVEIDGGNTYSIDEIVGVRLDDAQPATVLWRQRVSRLEKDPERAGYVYLSRADGRFVTERDWDRQHNSILHLWTLDPETGKVRARQTVKSTGRGDKYHNPFITENDLGPSNPHGMALVDDDIVFVDSKAVSRYDPLTGDWVWSTRMETMGLRNGDMDYAMFHLGPVSADGSMIYASLSEGPSGDLLGIDLETGEILARWALDDKQQAGLVNAPLMAVDGLDVVLARNRTAEGNPDLIDRHKRLGPANDLGLLRFPELEG